MVVTFGYFDAGNDWWWAMDNFKIQAKEVASVSISGLENQIVIVWEGSTLETANKITGPWIPVQNAPRTYFLNNLNGQQFFRAR